MKVLQVNCVYGKGSTGKITRDLHHALLSRGFESVVCYGRGDSITGPYVYKTCSELYSKINNLLSRITGVMYGCCFFSTNKLISIIKKERPDVVHLQCINGYFVNIYRILNWLKKKHINTVVTLHAEFMFTGGCGHSIDCIQWSTRTGCGHSKCPCFQKDIKSWLFDRSGTMWKRMKKAFDGFDENLLITSVSPWLMDRAKKSPILCDKKHEVVMNGLDTTVFYHRNNTTLREQYDLNDRVVVFHATPIFDINPNNIKGSSYVIELAKRLPDFAFVVAGEYNDLVVPDNMILLGKITDQTELAKWYSTADVTVITSKRETFSMIVAESLCCGTPVVGFKAGGPESIAIKEYSDFVEYGNVEGMIAALHNVISDKTIVNDELCQNFYSSWIMSERYINCYKVVMENEK